MMCKVYREGQEGACSLPLDPPFPHPSTQNNAPAPFSEPSRSPDATQTLAHHALPTLKTFYALALANPSTGRLTYPDNALALANPSTSRLTYPENALALANPSTSRLTYPDNALALANPSTSRLSTP
eukprot:115950-Chlamydomonas_euryale.AAC.4